MYTWWQNKIFKEVLMKITKHFKGTFLAFVLLMVVFMLSNNQEVMAANQKVKANQWNNVCLDGGKNQTYVFDMPSSGYFTVKVIDKYYTYSGKKSDSTLWYLPTKIVANDKIYENTNVHCNSGPWTSSMLSFKKGTKVKINFSSTSSSDYKWYYKFKITTTKPKNFEKENNNTKKKASKLSVGKTYTGLMTQDDIDFYVFTAPSDGKYKLFAVNSNMDGYYGLYCSLYNNSYKLLSSENFISGRGWGRINTVSLKKGQKVYLKFNSYSHNFKYKVKVNKA